MPWRGAHWARHAVPSLMLSNGRPAETGGEGGFVILALNHELGAALVKAEDFVVDVQAVHQEGQAVGHLDTALGVHLQVGVEINVAEGTFSPPGVTSEPPVPSV